jgi:hypothetical protein
MASHASGAISEDLKFGVIIGTLARRMSEAGLVIARLWPSLHQFISGAGHVYTTLRPTPYRTVTLDGQRFDPANPEARLYATFFCRNCGAPFCLWEKGSAFGDGKNPRKSGFGSGQTAKDKRVPLSLTLPLRTMLML